MCDYCAANQGTYDLTQRCCRARFTAHSGHSKARARAWCEFWRKVFPADEAEATIAEARKLWQERTLKSVNVTR